MILYKIATTRSLQSDQKLNIFNFKVGNSTRSKHLHDAVDCSTGRFSELYNWRGGTDCFTSTRELHLKLQIIEVLDLLQHRNCFITRFSARKWRNLNVTTGTTNGRSRHFQANWRTIFLNFFFENCDFTE